MSNTSISSTVRVQQWADDYFVEYVRDSRFKRYMGTSENSIIQVIEDLQKQAGDRITVPLVNRLTGAGVTGDSTLEGNEEALGQYGHLITVAQLRNAVSVGDAEQQKSKIDVLKAAKTMLKLWSMEKLRDAIIQALMSPVTDGVTAYASATEGQKDAWDLANNPSTSNQRILFGAAKSNESANDHSANLLNIDGTADDLHQDIISLGRRLAMLATPHIRPVRVGSDDAEVFVAFAPSLPFRDLEANMSTIHQNAAPRSMEDNPLFKPGDLLVGNVIVREVPEIPTISGVGAAGIDVAPVFLCGAQAVGCAWAKRPTPIFDERDYGNIKGAGIAEMRGVEKLVLGSGLRQHGVVTMYVSAVGD